MSSMGRKTIYSIALMAGTALVFPATAQAQEAGRSSLVAQQPGQMDQAVGQWEYLTARDDLPFACLLYTSPSPRDATLSRMPSSA